LGFPKVARNIAARPPKSRETTHLARFCQSSEVPSVRRGFFAGGQVFRGWPSWSGASLWRVSNHEAFRAAHPSRRGEDVAPHVVDACVSSQPFAASGFRSEERRVGKECRSRWSP